MPYVFPQMCQHTAEIPEAFAEKPFSKRTASVVCMVIYSITGAMGDRTWYIALNLFCVLVLRIAYMAVIAVPFTPVLRREVANPVRSAGVESLGEPAWPAL